MEQEYIEIKLVFVVKTKGVKKIPFNENSDCFKQFVYKISHDVIEKIISHDNPKEEFSSGFLSDRYFWEFLEDIDLTEPLRILNTEFHFNGKDYSFSYFNQDDEDNYWIETELYAEEFGMHSDFDFYEAHYGYNQKNKKYFFKN